MYRENIYVQFVSLLGQEFQQNKYLFAQLPTLFSIALLQSQNRLLKRPLQQVNLK